jgi:hypothetical protein
MTDAKSKEALQFCVAIGACVPVAAGAAGILLGPGMVDPDFGGSIMLDSHYRYLSGLLLGIGLTFWTLIPGIEKNGIQCRMLAMIIVIGGIGRLWAALDEGAPGCAMILALGMELIVTPLLAWWQYRLARRLGYA